MFFSYKQQNNQKKKKNYSEIRQNLNNLLKNLLAREKLHSAGFAIVIIKDDLYCKRKRTLNSLGTIKRVN